MKITFARAETFPSYSPHDLAPCVASVCAKHIKKSFIFVFVFIVQIWDLNEWNICPLTSQRVSLLLLAVACEIPRCSSGALTLSRRPLIHAGPRFLFFTVHLRDQWERRQGGSGKRNVRRGVRWEGPEQPSPHRHQGNPREGQHVWEHSHCFSHSGKLFPTVLGNRAALFFTRMSFSKTTIMGMDLAEGTLTAVLRIPSAL